VSRQRRSTETRVLTPFNTRRPGHSSADQLDHPATRRWVSQAPLLTAAADCFARPDVADLTIELATDSGFTRAVDPCVGRDRIDPCVRLPVGSASVHRSGRWPASIVVQRGTSWHTCRCWIAPAGALTNNPVELPPRRAAAEQGPQLSA
jgi:hypothetical protein